jgi:hypothetical protein
LTKDQVALMVVGELNGIKLAFVLKDELIADPDELRRSVYSLCEHLRSVIEEKEAING